MWLSELGRSFRYAGQGVARVVRQERNLRIHLTAVVYVTALGLAAQLDGPHWGVVLLCFAAVITAELFNTAIERLCDTVHPEQSPGIGFAKDAAAGAVLVLTLASVGVAVAVFGPWIMAGGLMRLCAARPWLAPAFFLSVLPAILWIRGKKSWK